MSSINVLYGLLSVWVAIGLLFTTIILWLFYTSPVKVAMMFANTGVEQQTLNLFLEIQKKWKEESLLAKALRLVLFVVLSPMVMLAVLALWLSASIAGMINKSSK